MSSTSLCPARGAPKRTAPELSSHRQALSTAPLTSAAPPADGKGRCTPEIDNGSDRGVASVGARLAGQADAGARQRDRASWATSLRSGSSAGITAGSAMTIRLLSDQVPVRPGSGRCQGS
jgi:hypothetical protein